MSAAWNKQAQTTIKAAKENERPGVLPIAIVRSGCAFLPVTQLFDVMPSKSAKARVCSCVCLVATHIRGYWFP